MHIFKKDSEDMEDQEQSKHGYLKPRKGYRPFLVVVLLFSLFLTYLIIRPFLHTLIMAVILASLFHPLQVRVVRLYRNRESLAALTVVLVIVFVILIPIFLFFTALVSQGVEAVNHMTVWLSEGNLERLLESERALTIMNWLHTRMTFLEFQRLDLQAELMKYSTDFGQFLISKGAAILGNVVNLITNFLIMVFLLFYLVRDGSEMVDGVKYLSPLREDQEDRIIGGIRTVARSVLLGSFLTALAQGIAGGIGLAIVGIPGLFWGTIMGFSSLIPVVGTALVWMPAVVYLFLLGETQYAVFLLIWSIILVGSIDNFLRPFLMRGEARMSPFYVFLAIIGGIQYFGLVGILYGPLIMSFAMVMLFIYGTEFSDLLESMRGKHPLIISDEKPKSDE